MSSSSLLETTCAEYDLDFAFAYGMYYEEKSAGLREVSIL
jgi:hypothetical protein